MIRTGCQFNLINYRCFYYVSLRMNIVQALPIAHNALLHFISIQPACQHHRPDTYQIPSHCVTLFGGGQIVSLVVRRYTQLAFGFLHVCVIMHTLPFSVICLCALNLFLEGRRVQSSLFSHILSQGQNTATTCYPPLNPSILHNDSDISTFPIVFPCESHSVNIKGALFSLHIFFRSFRVIGTNAVIRENKLQCNPFWHWPRQCMSSQGAYVAIDRSGCYYKCPTTPWKGSLERSTTCFVTARVYHSILNQFKQWFSRKYLPPKMMGKNVPSGVIPKSPGVMNHKCQGT